MPSFACSRNRWASLVGNFLGKNTESSAIVTLVRIEFHAVAESGEKQAVFRVG